MTCVLLQHALSRLTAFAAPTKSWSRTLLPRIYFRPHAPSATSKHLSEEGDYDCAARWGAGPWKVGVLAGLLFGFDVFVGQIDPATVAASPRLSLQREHIRRARELHGLLEHMRAAWAVNSDAFTAPEQVLLQDPEFVAGLAPGHGRLPSQMEELPQQQQEEEEEEDAAGNRRAVPAAWEPGQLNVIQRLWEELELEPHIIMMDTAVDMKTGYGAHGASVQVWPADQTPWLSDREVTQKLFLVGKPEIPLREFASKLRRYNKVEPKAKNQPKDKKDKEPKRAKQTPQCFPKAMLEQVVEAGLHLYPVGKLVSKGKTDARLALFKPPSPEQGRRTVNCGLPQPVDEFVPGRRTAAPQSVDSECGSASGSAGRVNQMWLSRHVTCCSTLSDFGPCSGRSARFAAKSQACKLQTVHLHLMRNS